MFGLEYDGIRCSNSIFVELSGSKDQVGIQSYKWIFHNSLFPIFQCFQNVLIFLSKQHVCHDTYIEPFASVEECAEL